MNLWQSSYPSFQNVCGLATTHYLVLRYFSYCFKTIDLYFYNYLICACTHVHVCSLHTNTGVGTMSVCSHRGQRRRKKILLHCPILSLSKGLSLKSTPGYLTVSPSWQSSCLCSPQCWGYRLAPMTDLYAGAVHPNSGPQENCYPQSHKTDFLLQDQDVCTNFLFGKACLERQ